MEVLIPAREGRGVRIRRGDVLSIIDVEGHQVADLVAYVEPARTEYLSPGHTVSCNASIALGAGATVFSNLRNPVLSVLRDDVGRHDLVVPCCDPARYFRDFGLADHASCLANLEQAAGLLGETVEVHGEQAWNVFMHNRVTEAGSVVTDRAAHEAGSTIALRAEADLLVLVSACPQDLTPCNDFNPTQLLLRVDPAPRP